VPFLRFSRDKRGYEVFALVQPDQRGGQSKPRVLYAFRTPPNIKVGRDPFDDETRKELEAANPGVGFNWRQIKETPIPSADAEMWRERRRAMKEAKRAAKKDEEESQRAAADAQPGESRSARRRRRRKARLAEAGSENPKIEETSEQSAEEPPAETADEPEPSS
jgi:hypothetical protein